MQPEEVTSSSINSAGNSSNDHALENGKRLPRSLKASLVLNLSVLAFGIFLSLGLIELGFRSYQAIVPKQKVRFGHPVSYYYLPQNSFDSRNAAYSESKPADTFRIVVVGDSFTFAGKGQYDDAFPARLQRMLNLNANQRKVEVINWGVPGYATFHEVKLVERAVNRLSPDLILLQITLNDFEKVPFQASHYFQDKQGRVILSSPIFQYWKSLGFIVGRVINVILEREYLRYYDDILHNPRNQYEFIKSIIEIKNIARSHHTKVVGVLFPLFSHVLDSNYKFSAHHQFVRKVFVENRIKLIDLLESYRFIPNTYLEVNPLDDSHPNEVAHRIAADTIYQSLAKTKLLPNDIKISRISHRRHQWMW